MTKDYYKILGINRDATEADIKKAYRKLVVKYHPDKTGNDKEAEVKFKELSEAYETLSNPDKKAKYDNPMMNGFNASDLFRNFWSGNPFQSGFKEDRHINKGRNINTVVALTLEEMMTGTIKRIKVNRRTQCPTCKGTGAENAEIITCSHCNGTGVNTTFRYAGSTRIAMQETCIYCGGSGSLAKSNCNSCNGSGTISTPDEIEISIPKGSIAGVSFVVAQKGDWAKSPSNPGDLIIGVEEYAHPVYRRDGINLICDKFLTFKEICLGVELELPNLKNGKFKINIPAGTQAGKMFRLKGMGIPEFNGFGVGDILIQVNVKIPETLTDEQIKAIEYF